MANYNQVSYGSQGGDVRTLQELLNQNGYNLSVDGIFGEKTKAAVTNYQTKKGLAVDGIVGKNTWGALTAVQTPAPQEPAQPTAPAAPQQEAPKFEYQPSNTIAQANALLQQHMASKPVEYQSTWEGQLNDTIAQILNREKFSYDLNGDMLYQQYKDQYTTQGKLAMMDTMGQAAAMTGGYGNSYAQTAGQQAYQAYLQQLNDVVPELYGMALDQYNQEGQNLYNQASLLGQMEDQEYGRYRDQLSDYYTDLNYLTENARYMSETEYQQALDAFNIKYGAYRDTVGDQQWQAQFDEGVRQYNEQFAYQQEQDSVANASSGVSNGGNGNPGIDNSGYGDPGSKYTAPDGWTEADVKEFQRRYGLDVDGIFGPKTQYVYDLVDDLNSFVREGEPKSKISAVLREELDSGKISKSLHDVLKGEFVPRGNTY